MSSARFVTLALSIACGAAAACSSNSPHATGSGGAGGSGAGGQGGSGVVPDLLTVVTDRFPAADATGICSDTQLRLTFSVPVAVGNSGKIQIWKQGDATTPVDTIDLGATYFDDTIGGRHFSLNRPVFVDGMQAVIYLHRAAMAAATPGDSYYVTIDGGVFVVPAAGADAGTTTLGAITAPEAWRFTTRAAAPASPDHLVVAGDNSADFCTVQSAIDLIPAANTSPVTVDIKNGTYREIVLIGGKNNITIHGEDRKNTIIAYANNNTLQTTTPGGVGGTGNRAMIEVERSNGLTIENITLHNTTPQGGSQAEALRVEPGDQIIVRDSDLISLQDTVLLSGRAYVTNSYIEGNVDFIWGKGTAYFESCEIKTVGRPGYNVQSRNPDGVYGYIFVDSKITGSAGLFGHYLARIDGSVYPASNVAYINCELGSHISPAGWQITGTTDFSLIRFWEYHSHDPTGAPVDLSLRHAASRQLTDDEAAMYRDKTVIFAQPAPAWNPTP